MRHRYIPEQPQLRIRPRTHQRPDLAKIQEYEAPITIDNGEDMPSIGILDFTARLLLKPTTGARRP